MKATAAVANTIVIINNNIIKNNKDSHNDIPITAAIPLPSKPPFRRSRGFVVDRLLCLFCYTLVITTTKITTASAMSTTNGGGTGDPAAAATARDSTAELARSTIDFLTVARGLKTTPRTGWIRQKAGPRIESVADHSWRMSLMAMVAASSANANAKASTGSDDDPDGLAPTTRYDTDRCIKIALVHDLAEATVGDITPHCGVSDATKHDLELEAITGMTSKLVPGGGDTTTTSSPSATSGVSAEILALWKEYEAGETPEAKLVKDMDKLEMILQALEYETDGKNEESLDGFFDSTRDKWRTPIGRAWGEEINRRRPKSRRDAEPAEPKGDGASGS